jgi:hypothetical protein
MGSGSETLEEAGYTPADVVTVIMGALGGPEGSVTGVIVSDPGAAVTVVRMYSGRRLWDDPYEVATADIKEIMHRTG